MLKLQQRGIFISTFNNTNTNKINTSMQLSKAVIVLVLKGTRQEFGGYGWRYYKGPTIALKG